MCGAQKHHRDPGRCENSCLAGQAKIAVDKAGICCGWFDLGNVAGSTSRPVLRGSGRRSSRNTPLWRSSAGCILLHNPKSLMRSTRTSFRACLGEWFLLVLGIRPSHLRIQSTGESNGSVGAEVFVVEPLGDMNVVTVQMEDLRFQVLAAPHYRSSPGAPVRISVDRQQLLLFDKETGHATPFR